tara:strand:- start:8432 stop:10192 length:1761 start_codon:yes stop_codon:yes gene_type:complete
MKIEFKKIKQNNPLLIAETACGHNGDIKKLIKLINIAKNSGIKAIKFQIFKLDERSVPNSKEEKIFKNLTLSESEWKKAVNWAHKKKLFVFADIFGLDSLNLAEKIKVDGYKIHSEDALNHTFIEKVLSKNKITIIGIGGSYRSELISLVNNLVNKSLNNKIILMAGFQVFPTPLKSHSISEIIDLKDKYSKFNFKIGFSDHMQGGSEESFLLPILALSSGAEVIEKHFTINRKLKLIDYYSSLNPNELKIFNIKLKNYLNLFKPIGDLSTDELKYRNMFKKFITTKVNKKKGDLIKENEIEFKKNKKEGQSLTFNQIKGKKLKQDLNAGSPLKLKYFEQKVGAIIVARMTSNRLPGKSLKKIGNRESIALLIDRIKKIKRCDEIILATSTDVSDDLLASISKRENIKCYRGSLENVALRYYEAAKEYSLDQVLRITGDAILCDVVMLDKAIEHHLNNANDVTFIKNMPYGTAKEVFSYRTIKTISNYSKINKNTEYLEWFLENGRNFKVGYIKSNYKFKKNIRLTLDFEEDLIQLNKIFNDLKHLDHIKIQDVINYLNKNPKVIKINSHLIPKFKKIEKNTELNI